MLMPWCTWHVGAQQLLQETRAHDAGDGVLRAAAHVQRSVVQQRRRPPRVHLRTRCRPQLQHLRMMALCFLLQRVSWQHLRRSVTGVATCNACAPSRHCQSASGGPADMRHLQRGPGCLRAATGRAAWRLTLKLPAVRPQLHYRWAYSRRTGASARRTAATAAALQSPFPWLARSGWLTVLPHHVA
jgi:hypothetical protein